MIDFFDAHTHLQFNAFANDFKEVAERAFRAKIGMINIGTQKYTSKKAVEIAHLYDNDPIKNKMIYASVGLHPIHVSNPHPDSKEIDVNHQACEKEFDFNYYQKLSEDKKVLAIGECGLDYFRIENEAQKLKQAEVFELQLKLAYKTKKPLMIHCREAFSDLIQVLEKNKNLLNNPPGIIHFFSGTKENASKLLNLGFYFTFGGIITFIPKYAELVKFIPNDKILSETDAPYVSPAPHRGKRNEPLYLIEIVKKIAQIKNINLEKMKNQIIKNTFYVFSLNLDN